MTETSHELILNVTKSYYNTAYSNLLYFKHQISLPLEFRVCEIPEEELKSSIKALTVNIDETRAAIDELKKIPIDASPHQTN